MIDESHAVFHYQRLMRAMMFSVFSFAFCLFTFAFRASGLPSFARLRNGLPVA